MPPFDSSHGPRGVPTPTRPGRLLRFVAVNAEGGRQNGKGLRALLRKLKVGPLIAAIDEGDGPSSVPSRVWDALTSGLWAKLHRVRIYHGSGTHGAREVGHAVMGGVVVDSHETRILTMGQGWAGDTQDRHVDILLASVKRSTTKVASLSTHAPTGTHTKTGSWAANDQAARWRDGLATLAGILSEVRGKGYAPVVSGDFNEADSANPDGLRAWATANGLVAYVTGVMWVLVDHTLHVEAHRVIPLAGLNVSDHRTALQVDVALVEVAPKPKPVPVDPYAKTTHDGKTVDCLTDAALIEAERRLGYPLTIVQGSYNKGGVSQSAGTHDGGGAVDLTPYDWAKKVHIMRAIGFAAWHRKAIPGTWAEHVHCIQIGNAKLSPAAAAQVIDYRNHRDGLAGNGPDNSWHPSPIPTFKFPKDYTLP